MSAPSTMTSSPVTHGDLVAFADQRINLKRDDVKDEREQVNRLRDRLEEYINDHPAFDLVKMLSSGSLAKGTALKTINDADVAVYVCEGDAPTDEKLLISWLEDRLRKAFPDAWKIESRIHCVTITYSENRLAVDVVPVLYEDDPDWYGFLITQDTGDRVLTCIPDHLKFIRSRKDHFPVKFRQMIRFVKWWARKRKLADPSFRCKSFLLELLVAHLFDGGMDASDYTEALEAFFAYIVRTELGELIVFADFYDVKDVAPDGRPIQVFDPVNPVNNVAFRYTTTERDALVAAAEEALDPIAYAKYATTKAIAVEQWRKVLGTEFTA